MATSHKPFDAVQMMRSIRDGISEQIRDMTFEEEQAYIRKHLCDESVDGSSGAGKENCVQAGLAVQDKGKP